MSEHIIANGPKVLRRCFFNLILIFLEEKWYGHGRTGRTASCGLVLRPSAMYFGEMF